MTPSSCRIFSAFSAKVLPDTDAGSAGSDCAAGTAAAGAAATGGDAAAEGDDAVVGAL